MDIMKETTVTLQDDKCSWKIKPSDVTNVGNQEFLRLPRGGIGLPLTRLIVSECNTLPESLPDKFSTTSSVGFSTLLQIRNEEQSKSFITKEDSKIPEMLRKRNSTVAVKTPTKMPGQRRQLMQERKADPSIMTIEVPGCLGSLPFH